MINAFLFKIYLISFFLINITELKIIKNND